MAETERFKKWFLKESDLGDLTPSKVRSLIIECFYEAQKETFRNIKKQIGANSTDEEIRKTVIAGIKLAFKKVGADFEKPTKDSLLLVVAYLARQAASWGTPPDIIQHHKTQLQKVISFLK